MHRAVTVQLADSDERKEDVTSKQNKAKSNTDTHILARPLKFVRDKDGIGWLSDRDIGVNGNLRAQGYWRCDEMAFPTGGR